MLAYGPPMSTSAAVSAFEPAPVRPVSPTIQRRHRRQIVSSTTLLVGTVLALAVAVADDWHVGTDVGLRIPKYSSLTTIGGSAAERALADAAADVDGELAVASLDGAGFGQRPFIGNDSIVLIDGGADAAHTVFIGSDDAVVVRGSEAPLVVEVHPWQGTTTTTRHLIDIDGPLRLVHAVRDRHVFLPLLLVVFVVSLIAGRISAARFVPSDHASVMARRRRRALLLPAVITPLVAMIVLHQLLALGFASVLEGLGSYQTTDRDQDAMTDAIVVGFMALPVLALLRVTITDARARLDGRPVGGGWWRFALACFASVLVPAAWTIVASIVGVVVVLGVAVVAAVVTWRQREAFVVLDPLAM